MNKKRSSNINILERYIMPSYHPSFKISKKNTALIIFDMQYLNAYSDYGYINQIIQKGLENKIIFFKKRLKKIIPKIIRLQEKFREKNMEIIYTRVQSLTSDGRDRGYIHKNLNILAYPGSKEAEIIEELEPLGDEIILNKTATSVFNSTNIDYILRNMGLKCLIMVGMMNSVEAAARDGYEKGYYVKVVEDACCSEKPKFHKQSVETINFIYGEVVQVDSVIETLNKL